MNYFRSLLQHKKYRKILLWGVVIGVVSLAGIAYELYSSYRLESARASIQVDNLSLVIERQLSAVITKFDLTMSETVRTIENKRGTHSLSKSEIKEVLEERKQDIPEASAFFVLDKNGVDLFRFKDGVPYSFGDRAYFQEQKNSLTNELIISKPYIGRVSNVNSIIFSRKISNRANQFDGIIGVAIPVSYFGNLYSKLDVGKEGVVSLIGKKQQIYTRYASRFFSKMDHFESLRQVGNTNLYVQVGISKNEVLAHWKLRCLFYLVSLLFFWGGGAVYLLRNLRALMELDEQKKASLQNAKLVSLGVMAAGVAHEINNPLAIIHSRVLMLKKQIERDQYDPIAFQESLTKINLTVDRIAKIIRGLKIFSRNSEAEAFLPVKLESIIDSTLGLCQEKFRHNMVLLKVDAIPDVLIECRESQMVQVMLNLLNNAYDAVEHFEERWVHLSFSPVSNGMIRIVVTDSGKGIPEEVAQNIMQPFYTTKEVGKGTGLGLSISKGIIDDHRGDIFLNRDSVHTSFVIELPAKTEIVSIARSA